MGEQGGLGRGADRGQAVVAGRALPRGFEEKLRTTLGDVLESCGRVNVCVVLLSALLSLRV